MLDLLHLNAKSCLNYREVSVSVFLKTQMAAKLILIALKICAHVLL